MSEIQRPAAILHGDCRWYPKHLEDVWVAQLVGLLAQLRSKARPKGGGELSFDLKPHLIQDRDEVLLQDIDAILKET